MPHLPWNDPFDERGTVSFPLFSFCFAFFFMISRRFREEISSLGKKTAKKYSIKRQNICDLKWQIWLQWSVRVDENREQLICYAVNFHLSINRIAFRWLTKRAFATNCTGNRIIMLHRGIKAPIKAITLWIWNELKNFNPMNESFLWECVGAKGSYFRCNSLEFMTNYENRVYMHGNELTPSANMRFFQLQNSQLSCQLHLCNILFNTCL